MTRNTLNDLNDHLFAAIERLGDEDLTGSALTAEIQRAKAMAAVAGVIVSNAAIQMQAFKTATDCLMVGQAAPTMPQIMSDTMKAKQ